MATSGILDMVNSVLTALGDIPYNWGNLAIVHSRPNNLFQLVAMWNDQVTRERTGGGYTFEKPACFLQLIPEKTETLLSNVSFQTYCLRLHIVDMELDSADGKLDQNLNVFTYRDLVKNYLVGFTPANSSTLFYTDERQDYTHDDVYHYQLDLKCGFTDLKGSVLDPDQPKVIYKDPPTDGELNIGFGNPPSGTDPQTLEITPTI